MKKRIIGSVLVASMVLAMAGCGSSAPNTNASAASSSQAVTAASSASSSESDVDYIKNKGSLIVGITDFAPMDYKEDGSDEWIGFDADLAREVGKDLGVDVKFVEIDWDNKILELDNKSIDVVWNGMTLTDEVTKSMA